MRFHAHLLAGLNVFAFEVAAIGHDVGLLELQFAFGGLRYRRQLSLIHHGLRRFGGDQQVMFGIHAALHIVADHVALFAFHRTAVGVSGRELGLSALGQLLPPLLNLGLVLL